MWDNQEPAFLYGEAGLLFPSFGGVALAPRAGMGGDAAEPGVLDGPGRALAEPLVIRDSRCGGRASHELRPSEQGVGNL